MKLKCQKDELIWFLLFAAVSIIPFWLVKFVPSLDGPSHLYNARLINEILTGDSFITQFYRINPIVVGNATAHYTMALLMFIFPAWLSEKILLTLYIIGLALSFRYFIKSLDNSGSLLYLIIFPFGFHSLFLFGYYNFSIAFIPLFMTLGYLNRNEGHFGIRQFIWITVLLLLIYLSHAVVFVFAGLIIFLQLLYDTASRFFSKDPSLKSWGTILKKYLVILAAAIPAIYLWLKYFASLNNDEPAEQLSGFNLFIKNLNNLVNLKFLVGFNHEEEDGPIILTMIALAGFLLIIFLRRRIKSLKFLVADARFNTQSILWGVISVFLILFLFLLPNHMTTGSITARFNILLYFTLITWISLHKLPRSINYAGLALIFFAFTWHRMVTVKYYKELNVVIKDIIITEPFLKPNTIFFPVNCTENWLETHFHCYLGVDKPLVNIRNLQANGQMPVVWKFKKMPNILLGDKDLQTVGISWLEDETNPKDVTADYIYILKPNRADKVEYAGELIRSLEPDYTVIYESPLKFSRLLELKQQVNK
jgi:hypothetical protein